MLPPRAAPEIVISVPPLKRTISLVRDEPTDAYLKSCSDGSRLLWVPPVKPILLWVPSLSR